MAEDSLFYSADHDLFRHQVRRFVSKEIEPNAEEWDEAGTFPRALYAKAAEVGALQVRFPEDCGGVPADRFFSIIVQQEFSRAGTGGVSASLLSHTLALPSVAAHGSQALKARVLPEVLAGRKIAALAVTEPGGGSDVANLRTTARRERDLYIVTGEKTFITSGMRADFLTVAVRTGGPGTGGISLLVIDGDTPGLTRTPLRKTGWWASDTATLHFDSCRVPAANLVGPENQGFRLLAATFNDERLGLAASAIGFARLAFEEALAYARMRETFGQRLVHHQVIRHKLVDMAQRVAASQAFLETTAWRMDQGSEPFGDLCMLKNQATQTLAFCASEAVQIFGGAGYLRGSKVERIYREVKVNAIGGGSEEIMKELAAKLLKF